MSPLPYRCEALERRVLLSSIVWTNRGTASDGFNGVFGGNAELARNVVDAALLAWQNVIADFNQSDGGNTLALNISMVPTQKNGGAASDFEELDGKPISASITIDSGNDGQGGGWFLDPTPASNEEFRGDIINPFVGDAQLGSPAAGKFDLYTLVASEVCHALGLNNDGDQLFQEDPSGFLVNTAQGDAAFPGKGTLYRFTSPNVRMLYTSNNGGATGTDTGDPVHIAEPNPGNIGNVGPDFYFGIEDVNNAQYESSRRYLPSWHTALILQDVYGFTLNNIASFANFYANFDPGTGELLLRGGQPGDAVYQPGVPSDDSFNVVKSAGALVVAQDIGNDIPGALPTGYIISEFNAGLVDTVTIDTGDGNDSVIIGVDGDFQLNSAQVLTGSQTYNYSNIESMTLSGNFTTADTIRIDGTDTSVSYTINTFGGNDIIDVEGASAGSGLFIDGGDDADTLYFGFIGADLDNTAGQISFIGGNGFDVIRVQDQADNTDNNYRLSSGGLAEGAFLRNASLSVFYASADEIDFYAGDGDDDIDFRGTAVISNTRTNIYGGFGADTIAIDSNGVAQGGTANDIAAQCIVDGGSGSDILLIHDGGDASANTMTLTDSQIGAAAGDNFFGPGGNFTYSSIATLTIDMGRAGNVAVVNSTASQTTTTINTGEGGDSIFIDSNGRFAAGGTVNDVKSSLTINGGAGANTLIAEDSNDPSGDTMTVTGALADGTVGATAGDGFFGNSGALYYSGLAAMTLNMGTGGDTAWVRSTAAFINTTTINTGGGTDNIKVDSNGPAALGNLNGVKSMLVLDGGPGPNFAVLEDTLDAAANAVTLTSTQVGVGSSDNFFGSGGKLTYASLTSLTLNMGDGGNDINVQSTGCGTSIYTGGGSDTVTIDSNGIGAGGTVDLVQHTLFLNGQGGSDGLSMNDQSDATGDTFNITNAQIGAMPGNNFFGIGGSIGYLDFSLITVGATSGPDGIIVNATAAGTPLIIRGNDGGDVLHVFAPIASSISFQGGNPTVPLGDSLEIVGNGATQGSYTPSSTTPGSGTILLDGQTLTFSALEPITVSAMLDFQVITPSSHDVITIDRPVPGRNRVTGSSDGVAFESLTFFDVQRFTLNTGLADGTTAQSSDDSITIASPGLEATGLVNFKLIGGVGFDRLNVNGGTFSFDTDAFPDTQSLDVNVNNATVLFKATEHLNALNLLPQSHAQMTAGGNHVLVVQSLFIDTANKAQLDLTDQDMILKYSGSVGGALGTWNGSAYTGVSGLIQSGRTDTGAWDGPGITTSKPDAAAGLTGIGVGEVADLLGLSGSQTDTWDGEPVDATTLIVKYTYAGDANLDGTIDGGDYGIIDNFSQVPGAFHYFNGDFNYDGVIDGGDFGIIDNNIQAQGVPL